MFHPVVFLVFFVFFFHPNSIQSDASDTSDEESEEYDEEKEDDDELERQFSGLQRPISKAVSLLLLTPIRTLTEGTERYMSLAEDAGRFLNIVVCESVLLIKHINTRVCDAKSENKSTSQGQGGRRQDAQDPKQAQPGSPSPQICIQHARTLEFLLVLYITVAFGL
jgi:hypothetical protein